MTNSHSSVGRERDRNGNRTSPAAGLEVLRERSAARRRRARKDRRETTHWVANRSRRQKVRTLAVCTGTLLLMALGLYFGLAHEESRGPFQSTARIGAAGVV